MKRDVGDALWAGCRWASAASKWFGVLVEFKVGRVCFVKLVGKPDLLPWVKERSFILGWQSTTRIVSGSARAVQLRNLYISGAAEASA